MKLPIKLPWQKNSDQISSLPPEVQQYYAQSRKQRKSVAWLLAFTTLVATVVIALSAFFVGRWVYRKIAGSGDKPTTVVTTPGFPTNKPTTKPSKPAQSKPKSPKPVASTPDKLTNTGPGDTLAIFIITAVLGTGFYEYKLRRKLN